MPSGREDGTTPSLVDPSGPYTVGPQEPGWAGSNSFIVGFWAALFGALRMISVFGLVRAVSERLAADSRVRKTIASHAFVDGWALVHLFGALVAASSVASAARSAVVLGLAGYGLLRTFELVVYQANVLLFDEGRSEKSGSPYAVQSYRRTVLLLLQNFAEIILWFAVSYAAFAADLTVADASALGLIRDSFLATVSFGSSAPVYVSDAGLVVVFWQGVVGLFMTLLSLARFIGLLPPPREMSRP